MLAAIQGLTGKFSRDRYKTAAIFERGMMLALDPRA